MLRHPLKATLLAVLSTIWWAACGPSYLVEETHDIPQGQWTHPDTLQYRFSVMDTQTVYNLYLDVSHRSDYRYQNLYTRLHTRFPSGKRISQVVSLELAGKGGVWNGRCSGEYCTLEIPIQEGAYFNEVGDYVLTVEQYMRVSPLPGLRYITFKLQDSGVRR